MRHHRLLTGFVPLLALAGLLGACGDDFSPRHLINKTRILAIKADNPRLIPGQSARLSALVVAEGEDDVIERTWEFCLFTRGAEDAFACEFGDLDPELVSLLRSRERTFDLLYLPQLGPVIDEICAATENAIDEVPEGIVLPTCSAAGFPARVRLQVDNLTTGETWAAVKTLYIIPPSGVETTQQNANPTIASLAPSTEGQTLALGEPFEVECEVDQTSLETFQGANDDAPRSEEIQLSWFVRGTDVEFDDNVTLLSFEFDTVEASQLNELTVDTAGEVSVWCVIRDGRGGTDWKRLDLIAE